MEHSIDSDDDDFDVDRPNQKEAVPRRYCDATNIDFVSDSDEVPVNVNKIPVQERRSENVLDIRGDKMTVPATYCRDNMYGKLQERTMAKGYGHVDAKSKQPYTS